MPRRAALVWFVCLWVAGCGGGCSGAGPGGGASGDGTGGGGGGSQGHEGQADTAAVVDPGPAPEVTVIAEPARHARDVGLRVENHGAEVVQLSSAVGVERQDGDAFRAVDGVEMHLRFDCEVAPPECVTLAPGAAYLPPAWKAMVGHAQCECERCAAAPPGNYRFVVRSCNRAHAVVSEPFAVD
ncbi:MAG: hypothetical protein AB7S26_04010 [Sandaracinaceae bacterium]